MRRVSKADDGYGDEGENGSAEWVTSDRDEWNEETRLQRRVSRNKRRLGSIGGKTMRGMSRRDRERSQKAFLDVSAIILVALMGGLVLWLCFHHSVHIGEKIHRKRPFVNVSITHTTET